eukprot:2642028-Rhodomonas_salina.6
MTATASVLVFVLFVFLFLLLMMPRVIAVQFGWLHPEGEEAHCGRDQEVGGSSPLSSYAFRPSHSILRTLSSYDSPMRCPLLMLRVLRVEYAKSGSELGYGGTERTTA